MAKLYFKYGAMNSGKTTILLQTAHNYEERGMHVFVVKPSIDTKANEYISSRLGIKRKVDCLLSESDDIYKIIKKKKDINVVLVDECQFLKREQVDELMKITTDLNIPVLCYGLRTDFKTNGFEGSERLLLIAHSIEEIKTICRCGAKAIYNARFVNGKFELEGGQVEIDGRENITYESLCPKCYSKLVEKYYKS